MSRTNEEIENEIKLLQEILKLRNIVAEHVPMKIRICEYGTSNRFNDEYTMIGERLAELHLEMSSRPHQNIQEVLFNGEVDKDEFESSITYACESRLVDEELHEMINDKLLDHSVELYEMVGNYNEEKASREAQAEDIDEQADEFMSIFWNDLECADEEVKKEVLRRLKD